MADDVWAAILNEIGVIEGWVQDAARRGCPDADAAVADLLDLRARLGRVAEWSGRQAAAEGGDEA